MKSFALMACTIFAATLVLTSCGGQDGDDVSNTAQAPAEHGHDHAGHDHDHNHDRDEGHHDNPIELGTATIGAYEVRVARDEGPIEPGGDAPIDVWVTGDLAEIIAVRFWVGTEEAIGSIKARGEIEHPDTPNHFHAHADIPDPLPDSSMLWVELDIEGHGKIAHAFDLRAE